MNLEFIMTTNEVSKMLNCSVRNVLNLVKAEKIKPIKIIQNRALLFDKQDIELFINQKKNKISNQ